jgi:steroid 5-alpha reductase family enzyme
MPATATTNQATDTTPPSLADRRHRRGGPRRGSVRPTLRTVAVALLLSLLAVLVVIGVAFVVGRVRRRYRDIDVFWPLGFVAVAVVGFVATGATGVGERTQRLLLLVTVGAWGLRLAAHLAWRSRGEGEDPRYVLIMRRAPAGREVAYSLRAVYGLQAALLLFVSLPVTVGLRAGAPLRALQVVGTMVWLTGFAFEAIGDAQLARFRRDPANRGRVLDRGLWAWTRHPNYFGDATVWWGIFLIAAAGGWAWLTIASPVAMTVLLTRVSGKPMLERGMARTRPGYAEYVARTSGFLPRPPRRG